MDGRRSRDDDPLDAVEARDRVHDSGRAALARPPDACRRACDDVNVAAELAELTEDVPPPAAATTSPTIISSLRRRLRSTMFFASYRTLEAAKRCGDAPAEGPLHQLHERLLARHLPFELDALLVPERG